jgi:hypothetical protein
MINPFGTIRHPKKRAFLAAYSKVGIIGVAASVAGINRDTHQNWLKKDPDYVEAFEIAKDQSCDILEQEAIRRACQGVEEPVFYQGVECGRVRKYSDTLLIFMLKANRPWRFRDNSSVEHHGEVKLTVEHIDTGSNGNGQDE